MVPEIFSLKEQRTVSRRRFSAVDLSARYARQRAGRDQRGGVDAELRAVAQRERLSSGDQIVRGIDQEFGITADMQGVVFTVHDLPCDTGSGADLFRRPVGIRARGRVDPPGGWTPAVTASPDRGRVPAPAHGRGASPRGQTSRGYPPSER